MFLIVFFLTWRDIMRCSVQLSCFLNIKYVFYFLLNHKDFYISFILFQLICRLGSLVGH